MWECIICFQIDFHWHTTTEITAVPTAWTVKDRLAAVSGGDSHRAETILYSQKALMSYFLFVKIGCSGVQFENSEWQRINKLFYLAQPNSQHRLWKSSLIKHIVSVNDQNVPRHCRINVDQVSWNCLSRALQLQNFFLTAKKHLWKQNIIFSWF